MMGDLNLPKFPENKLGLKRGTLLKAIHEEAGQLGMRVGDRFPIGYDGEYVRCIQFTWSIDQLVEEIEVYDIWAVDGEIDLSDEQKSILFAQKVEGLSLVQQAS